MDSQQLPRLKKQRVFNALGDRFYSDHFRKDNLEQLKRSLSRQDSKKGDQDFEELAKADLSSKFSKLLSTVSNDQKVYRLVVKEGARRGFIK